MQLSLKQVTNKSTRHRRLGNRWLGADGLPSVVGSTSPSTKWSESIKETKNRHYKPSKSYSTTPQANKLQILQNQCHWIENFKTKLRQKDSYFSEFFGESYTLSNITLQSAFSKKKKKQKKTFQKSLKI